jgi:hypothetical protein
MLLQNRNERPSERPERKGGRSADGLMARLQQHRSSEAWRQTVTKHLPETWPAARLALQARISALDLSHEEVA